MTTYRYTAESVDRTREVEEGTIEASDEAEAERKVKAQYSWDVDVTFDSPQPKELDRPAIHYVSDAESDFDKIKKLQE